MRRIRGRAQHAVLIAGSLVLAIGLISCGRTERREHPPVETVGDVSVLLVEPVAVPDYLEAVGTVAAAQTANLSSQLLAAIREIRTQEGARVRQGDVLVVLEDAQPRAARDGAAAALAAAEQEVVAAEAEFDLAAATLHRYQSLHEKKSVSPQEFDEVRARERAATARRELVRAAREQARAELEQAQVSFDYTRIRAPFDAVVVEKRADPGTLATPGMVLLTVEDTRRFRLEVSVDESEIGSVRLRQAVPVFLDALGEEELGGRVVQIVPAADPASRSFLVKVELPREERLRSGLFGRARFARGQRTGLLIPRTAIVERGQLDGVYVVGPDGIASLRYVTLGKKLGEQVEILSGLEAGERVVREPGARELAGKRIESNQP